MGIDKAFEFGQKFGLDMENVEKVLGASIGSGVETNPLQMAQAYSAFANDGVMKDAHLITRIETASGKVLAQHRETSTKVIDRSVADKMTSMMLGTYTNGTGVSADAMNYYLAGKTGTTETSFDVNLVNDQWYIAYTPDLVISQWVGFEQTDENHYIDSSSYWMAPTVFRTVADAILPNTAGTAFDVENAFVQNGIVAIQEEDTSASDSVVTSDQVQDITTQAQDLIEKTKQRILDANIPERAKTLWDTVRSWFE